jgi:hypothetical protein
MYKKFEEKDRLIFEIVDEPHYFKHYCDDQFIMYRYKKDRPFNEMRRDIYFNQFYQWYNGTDNMTEKLTKDYTNTKNELKQQNKSLHELFLNNMTHKIIKIVRDFNIVDVIKIPDVFNTEISNGRFNDYDGNGKCFLCCDDMYFYLLDWQGS